MNWTDWSQLYPAKQVTTRPQAVEGPYDTYFEAEQMRDWREVIDECAYTVVEYQSQYYVIGAT